MTKPYLFMWCLHYSHILVIFYQAYLFSCSDIISSSNLCNHLGIYKQRNVIFQVNYTAFGKTLCLEGARCVCSTQEVWYGWRHRVREFWDIAITVHAWSKAKGKPLMWFISEWRWEEIDHRRYIGRLFLESVSIVRVKDDDENMNQGISIKYF